MKSHLGYIKQPSYVSFVALISSSTRFYNLRSLSADLFQSVDEFRSLSNGKQSVELYKILSAIHTEISKLKASTETRFSILENIVAGQQNLRANGRSSNGAAAAAAAAAAASSGHWSEVSGGGGGYASTHRAGYSSRNAAG